MFLYSFVDTSSQFSCPNKTSFCSSVVLPERFSASLSTFALADRFRRNIVTETGVIQYSRGNRKHEVDRHGFKAINEGTDDAC